MRTSTLLLASLMMMMCFSPLVNADFENNNNSVERSVAPLLSDGIEQNVDIPSKLTNYDGLYDIVKLELKSTVPDMMMIELALDVAVPVLFN